MSLIEVTGMREARGAIQRYRQKAPQHLAAALYREGFRIMTESKEEVPREFGVLIRSGYVAPPTGLGSGDPEVEIGYGTRYALRQHEETTWNHPRGGKARYLVDPLNRARHGYLDRVALQTQRYIEQGVTPSSVTREHPPKPSEK